MGENIYIWTGGGGGEEGEERFFSSDTFQYSSCSSPSLHPSSPPQHTHTHNRYSGIKTVAPSTKVIDVLNILSRENVSALPVVDTNGVVLDIYCRRFVLYLSQDKQLASLDVPVSEALRHIRAKAREGEGTGETATQQPHHQQQQQHGKGEIAATGTDDIDSRFYTCSRSDTIQSLFMKFSIAQCSRLVCVDEDMRCRGMVTLSDLLSFFLGADDVTGVGGGGGAESEGMSYGIAEEDLVSEKDSGDGSSEFVVGEGTGSNDREVEIGAGGMMDITTSQPSAEQSSSSSSSVPASAASSAAASLTAGQQQQRLPFPMDLEASGALAMAAATGVSPQTQWRLMQRAERQKKQRTHHHHP